VKFLHRVYPAGHFVISLLFPAGALAFEPEAMQAAKREDRRSRKQAKGEDKR
jgi:hypothetical protein